MRHTHRVTTGLRLDSGLTPDPALRPMQPGRVTREAGGGDAAPGYVAGRVALAADLPPPGPPGTGGALAIPCWRPSRASRLISATLTTMFVAAAGLALFGGLLVLASGGQGGRAVALIPLSWATAIIFGLVRRVRYHVVSASVDADGTFWFRTRLRTVVVPAGTLHGIRSARGDAWALADLRVAARGQLLILPRAVQRLPELVAVARRKNPYADIADV